MPVVDYVDSTGNVSPMVGEFALSPIQHRLAGALVRAVDDTAYPELALVAPFGCGKTVIAMAVMKHLLEVGVKRRMYLVEFPASEQFYRHVVQPPPMPYAPYGNVIVQPRVVLPMIFVFVRRNTLQQWRAHLERAGLAVRVVSTALDFQSVGAELGVDRGGNVAPVWLVRDGDVRGTVHGKKIVNISTVDAMRRNLESHGLSVLAAFYDDFDKGNFTYGSGIPALVAFPISGSIASAASVPPAHVYPRAIAFDIGMSWCQPRFACPAPIDVELDMNVPKAHHIVYRIKTPYDDAIANVADLAGEEVQEMLNGLATNTAAARLGIAPASPAAMFRHVLADKYNEFVLKRNARVALHAAERRLPTLPTDVMHFDDAAVARAWNEAHGAGEFGAYGATGGYRELMAKCIGTLEDLADGTFTHEFVARFPRFFDLHGERLAEINADIRDLDVCLANVKRRLRTGACAVCRSTREMGLDGLFILFCCTCSLCPTCAAECTHRSGVMGRCPVCNAGIRFAAEEKVRSRKKAGTARDAEIAAAASMMFVAKELDIEEFLNSSALQSAKDLLRESREAAGAAGAAEAAGSAGAAEVSPHDKKLQVLARIIAGAPLDVPDTACETHDIELPNVLGQTECPPHRGVPKVVIFASYGESLKLVAEYLTARGTKFVQISFLTHSTVKHLERFRTDPDTNVLLVCLRSDSAGLNLQFATDLVFFNVTSGANQGAFAQAIGRVQRFGRTCAVRIHYLCFGNEAHRVTRYSKGVIAENPRAGGDAGPARLEPLGLTDDERLKLALYRRFVLESHNAHLAEEGLLAAVRESPLPSARAIRALPDDTPPPSLFGPWRAQVLAQPEQATDTVQQKLSLRRIHHLIRSETKSDD